MPRRATLRPALLGSLLLSGLLPLAGNAFGADLLVPVASGSAGVVGAGSSVASVPSRTSLTMAIDPRVLQGCRTSGCAEIGFGLPDGTHFVAHRIPLSVAGGGWSWLGQLDGAGNETLFLHWQEGYLNGKLLKGGKVFLLEAREGGEVLLSEVAPEQLRGDGPDDEVPGPLTGAAAEENDPLVLPRLAPSLPEPVLVDTPEGPANSFRAAGGAPILPPAAAATAAGASGGAANTVIDVMVVYSAEYSASFSSPAARDAEIATRIAESNTIYANSGIDQEVRLVHSQQVSLADNLTSSADVPTAEVTALRDLYGADLVSFWNTAGSAGSGSNYSGSTSAAFSTTEKSYVMTNFTFTHEMGHNMGAKHDRQTYIDQGRGGELTQELYHYGLCWSNYRTVMAYDNCSTPTCNRVMYFSTPLKSWSGAPLGIALGDVDPADNARRLNETKEAVAAFRATVVGYSSSAPGSSVAASSVAVSSSAALASSSTVAGSSAPESSSSDLSSSSEVTATAPSAFAAEAISIANADRRGVELALGAGQRAILQLTDPLGRRLLQLDLVGTGEPTRIAWGRPLPTGMLIAVVRTSKGQAAKVLRE